MRVAIVHDYLNQAGGAERVLAALHRMFPHAPIYTTIVDRATLPASLAEADIRTSWMQRLLGLKRHFKKYLPLYPLAIESFDLRHYDLVISSSSAFAKGARVRRDATHVCYCYTPMRFAWNYDAYVEREDLGRLTRTALPPLISALRRWDVRSAGRPSIYVAISQAVADRIQRFYGRPSEVVHPPVEVERFAPAPEHDDYYLIVSRLNSYKRLDLAVEAFNKLRRPLLVVGDGPDQTRLQRLARDNVSFLGRLSDVQVAEHYARCRAFVFPGEEDFGIAPLEANAAGRPVIAYQAGGALDTVVDGRTGVFFRRQTVGSLVEAVERSEGISWDQAELRRHAHRFSEQVFRTRLLEVLERALHGPGAAPRQDPSLEELVHGAACSAGCDS